MQPFTGPIAAVERTRDSARDIVPNHDCRSSGTASEVSPSRQTPLGESDR
ncbi:hypothetical protein [Haloarcula laminariae]|nr:hypothetical protein [Halomicroarcula sp. FL173]